MSNSMHHHKPNTVSRPLIIINLLLLVLFFVIVMGMVLSNYTAVIPIVASGLVAALSIFIISRFGWSRFFKILLLPFALILVVLACLAGFFLFLGTSPVYSPIFCDQGATRDSMELTSDDITITPEDFSKGVFLIKEHIVYNETKEECVSNAWSTVKPPTTIEKDLPDRRISSQGKGLFVQELVFDFGDLHAENSSVVRSAVPKIKLQDMPYKSFYDALSATSLRQDEYLGKETFTWSYDSPQQNIRLAYIPAPYNDVYFLVTPFIEISKYNNWILAIVGLVVNSMIVLNIKSLLSEGSKKSLSAIFSKPKSTTAQPKNTGHEAPSVKVSSQLPRNNAAIERSPAIVPAGIDRMLQQAKAELDTENYESAEKTLQQISVEKEIQSNAKYWLLAGRLMVYKKDWRSARNCFLQAKQLGDPVAEKVLQRLQQTRSSHGR